MSAGKGIDQRLAELPQAQRDRLQYLLRQKADVTSEPRPRDAGVRVPLSYGQRRLWMLEALSRGVGAYNEANSLRLSFPVDVTALRRALNELCARHEALRMTVEVIEGEPYQRFAASACVEVPIVDLRHLLRSQREGEALRMAAEHARVPFDLEAGPLVRATLYRLDGPDHLLVVTLHHLVCDGWSMGIFMVELLVLYWSFAAGKPSPLSSVPLQFGDYAVWQRQLLSAREQSQLEYWRRQLADFATLDLPRDRPRPAEFTFRGARCPVHIDVARTRALSDLAAREGVTLFILLYAIFAVLLHRYTGENDIVIGAPSAGRTRRAFERIIGFFVNTLVLRVRMEGDPTFSQLLQRAKSTTTSAYDHQDVPFERIVETLSPARDRSRNPLFQVAFQLMSKPSAPGLDERGLLPFVPVDTGIAKFDLSLELIATNEQDVRGHAEYCADLFDSVRIERMVRHFVRLIDSVISDPDRRLSALELRDDAEIHAMRAWSAAPTPYPRTQTLPRAFLDQVIRSPDAPALSGEGRTWTYASLRDQASVVAFTLIERGVKPGGFVGIHLERSAELVIVTIGVLLAGCAYVPLDPATPKQRLQYLIDDADLCAVVTAAPRSEVFETRAIELVTLDECVGSGSRPVEPSGSAEDPAYVMYTSGTTGRPKGVVVAHRNVVRLAYSPSLATISDDSRVLQFASASFDASTFEIWTCLMKGGQLVVYPSGTPSLEELGAFIEREKITVAFLTTSLFRQMIERCATCLRGVSQLVTGGEELPVADARAAWKALPRSRIVNAYGPTETTVIATAYVLGHPQTLRSSVPIGKPLENCSVHVLDAYGNSAPIGIPGELCIGGDGLAIGYWRRPELTEQKFVHARNEQDRIYRTGDIAAYAEDGNLLFLGRRDRQVKISGYRIELGEIEAAIRMHPRVRAAAVVVSDSQEKRLIACCQLEKSATLTLAELREFLAAELPQYMLPARLLLLDGLPLTRNGKLDTAALLALDSRPNMSTGPVAPTNTLETEILTMWCELLELDDAGVTDNFFDLGGQSLLATRLLSRIRARFGARISMRQFFDQPTVTNLARLVSAQELDDRARAEGPAQDRT